MTAKQQELYFWDDWRQQALAAGVPAHLAELGRRVLRAHRQDHWDADFLGVESDGPHMLEMCLEDPAHAELFFIENLYPFDSDLIYATRARLGLE